LNDPRTKDKLEKGPSRREHRKTQELARKRQTINEKAKKSSTLPLLSQCKISPFGRIYHIFHKLHSTTQLAKEFYHFVHILPPFDNELIKDKSREVDAMHEIKIWMVHRLYQ
jgi:hypothetical protein